MTRRFEFIDHLAGAQVVGFTAVMSFATGSTPLICAAVGLAIVFGLALVGLLWIERADRAHHPETTEGAS